MYLHCFLLVISLFCSNPTAAKGRILPIDNIQDINAAQRYITERGYLPNKNIIIVNINKQQLDLYNDRKLVKSYKASTSKRGWGQIFGSFRTPLGLHKISEKIGYGAQKNAVFKGRKIIGYWPHSVKNKSSDHIVSRILRLEGLEDGFNKGKDRFGNNVDSKDRTVYIHGSLANTSIGKPITPGCVFLTQNDVINLFNQVPVGTQVIITV